MKKKILIISDGVYLSTGFATVTRNLYKILKDKFEIRVLATVPHKSVYQKPIVYIPEGRDIADIFTDILKNYNPDLVISVSDIWRLGFIVDVKQDYPFNWLAYVPVEAEHLPLKVQYNGVFVNNYIILNYAEILVAYSKFGKEELEKFGLAVSDYIYHGVDTEFFQPLKIDRKQLLKSIFNIDNPDVRVFLCVCDNQNRKRLDLLIRAWGDYKKQYPESESILVLLTQPLKHNGYDIPKLLEIYNCSNSVFYFNEYLHGKGFTSEQLLTYYNLCDYFVMTSAGEGFGLPYLEAMACGKIPIYTDYATPKEIIADLGEPISVKEFYQAVGVYFKWAMIDVEKLVKIFYMCGRVRNNKNENCVKYAKKLDWKKLKAKWTVAINQAMQKSIKIGGKI